MFFTESKKSQAAIFIVVGIIVLAISGFMVYKYSESQKNKIKPSISSSINSLPSYGPVYEYISLCLNQASVDGIYLIGAQGGYIFQNQPGSVIQWPVFRITNFNNPLTDSVANVSYLLRTNYFYDPIDLASNPYPCQFCKDGYGVPLSEGEPPLYCSFLDNFSCTYGKPNSYLIDLEPPNPFSIQNQTASYIKSKLLSCLDFNLIESKLGHKVGRGAVSVNVSFGENDVVVNAKIPVIVNSSSGKSAFEFMDFKSTHNVRFRQIYNLLSEHGLIGQDIYSLHYSVSVNGTDSANKFFSPPFEVKVYHNVNARGDDIVMIIDNSSVLAGRPYVFQYARENRAPVLNTIHTPQFNDTDIVALEGQFLEFYPEGFDPDDDTLTYNYSKWMNSDWLMDSELYKQTNQSASITLSHEDMGWHNVTIKVSDGTFSDWQTVRVLVGYFRDDLACRDSKYGISKKLIYPEHPDESGVEIGFSPSPNGGCSDTTTVSDGTNGVFMCIDNNPVIAPAGQCCYPGVGGAADSFADPCVTAGYDSYCISTATRTCSSCTNVVPANEEWVCASGPGKICKTGKCELS